MLNIFLDLGGAPLVETGPGYPLKRLQDLGALAGIRYYP
jgi:hypothetical protein